MRRSLTPFTVAGYLSLLGTLVLSGPGVRVVRADEALSSQDPSLVAQLDEALPAAPSTVSGPSCSASEAPAPQVDLANVLEEARAELERAQAAGEVPPIVVLNNRGFNYGHGPEVGATAIQRELNVIRRERE